MNTLLSALIYVGLVPSNTVEEMQRWGVPLPDVRQSPPATAEQVSAVLESVLQDSGVHLVRETQLDVLPTFLRTLSKGTLHLVGAEPFEVSFGRTVNGEILLPWQGESLEDLLQDPDSCLLFAGNEGSVRFHATDVQEIFFGERKAFLVCAGEFVPCEAEKKEDANG
jgi:hypothetical protein